MIVLVLASCTIVLVLLYNHAVICIDFGIIPVLSTIITEVLVLSILYMQSQSVLLLIIVGEDDVIDSQLIIWKSVQVLSQDHCCSYPPLQFSNTLSELLHDHSVCI
jgi:hypothetical protein